MFREKNHNKLESPDTNLVCDKINGKRIGYSLMLGRLNMLKVSTS